MSELPKDAATSTAEPAATPSVVLLPRERGAAGLGLGRGLAVVVVVATVVPALLLVREALRDQTTAASVDVADASQSQGVENQVPENGFDLATLKAAIDVAAVEAEATRDAYGALLKRAVDAERGDRLRLVGRVIARARDARRAAGQTGVDLRGPFPASELGDLDSLGLGADRWLIGRDGALIAPAGVVVAAGLSTSGRDEDPLRLDVKGATLARRCVPNEGFCVIDVERAQAPVPVVNLAPLLRIATATPTTKAATTTQPTEPTRSSPLPLILAALLAIAGGAFVAWKLSMLSAQLRRRGWRLRAGLNGRGGDDDKSAVAELRELDVAIDDVLKGLGDTASVTQAQRHRRERVLAAAAALDDARGRGGVPRLVADEDDDAAVAALSFSVNALLDVLDARATRFKLAIDDVEGAMKVLTPLAQRLLRLARLPEMPSQAVDELNSLGSAVGQRARRSGGLPALLDEVARLAPASSDLLVRAEALKTLPDTDALRLGVAAQRGADSGEISTTERSKSSDDSHT